MSARPRRLARSAFVAALALGSVTATAAGTIERQTLEVAGATRTYYFYEPASDPGQASRPLLVLLHPTGGEGRSMARSWTAIADREGLVLIAPNATTPAGWRIREDGPEFLRHVIEAAASRVAIDPRRVYLFGYSAGAVHTLTVGMLESEYFAAIALYAGSWRDKASYATLEVATRKIPVAIFIGDRDEEFPLGTVESTRAALVKAGHPVELTLLRGQGHVMPASVAGVNHDAWAFLKPIALPDAPRFRSYR